MIEIAVPTMMRPIEVPTPGQGNPLYPLPPDYEELTSEGQKLARLNAICRQSTPEDYVASWAFFRSYYLSPPETHFYDQVVDSPALHYHLVRDVCLSPAAIIVVPRGFAKSVILTEEMTLLETLTRPGLRTAIVKSKGDFVTDMFDKLRVQLEENPYILEDFGKLRPPRGGGVWDYRHIRLSTHAHIFGLTIDGKGRGLRTHIIKLDDVEYDPSGSTDRQALTKAFVHKLTRVYIPMMRLGARILVEGTLLDRDVFLFHCATTKTDPRFSDKIWSRRIYGALDEQGESLWPQAYPTEMLRERRIIMGDSAFQAEYLSNPGIPEDAILRVDEGVEYSVAPDDDGQYTYLDAPLESEALVTYNEVSHNVLLGEPREFIVRERPLADILENQRRFITVDYAPTVSPHSDFSVIQVFGIDKRRDLWSWDLWVDRKTESELIRAIWRYAAKWRVQAVAIEAVGLQQSFVNQVRESRERRLQEGMWVPQLIPLKYKNQAAKETRIARTEWRFNAGKIKLPTHLKYMWPYKELFYEIGHFSPAGKTLAKDDPIDTLAMAEELLGSHPITAPTGPTHASTVVEALERGELYMPGTKIPLAATIDFNSIPARVLEKMKWAYYEKEQARMLQEREDAHHQQLVSDLMGLNNLEEYDE